MTTNVRVALVPRDGIFCKDGRGWQTSSAGRGYALDWPWPSTILGALRTAWGRLEEHRTKTAFGANEWRTRTGLQLTRTLTLRRPFNAYWTSDHVVWPVPSDALWVQDRGEVVRLNPTPSPVPTLGRDDDAIRESLWRPTVEFEGKPLARPRWLSAQDFASWLAGVSVSAHSDTAVPSPTKRRQTRIGIRPDELTAGDGALFSHEVLETLERCAEWAIGAEVTLPSGSFPPVGALGSDSRTVKIEPIPPTLFDPPQRVIDSFSDGMFGMRLVAVTPLCFEGGWLPDGIHVTEGLYQGTLKPLEGELILRAAFVGRPVHVSGWDMAVQAPKPTSRMAPPGSVFFIQRADRKPFTKADARSMWLARLGGRTDEGFGLVVPGTWNLPKSNHHEN
ncbi:MAG TPA: type III-B CRISPR module-associated Cmr3 family protein [Edaphobacter sp.]|nr:type III-B CRISPR module-associated Cmr3 family protein [Edaphobacter sp.]